MKSLLSFLWVIFAIGVTHANVLIPRAQLVGESVDVLLTNRDAIVNGLLQFNDWQTKDQKVVYLPIYSADGIDPMRLLALAQVELEIAGKRLIEVEPCEAPLGFKRISGVPRIQWFMFRLDLGAIGVEEIEGSPRVRISYIQPLIRGVFYYLPVIAGMQDEGERAWQFQMHVRRSSLPPHVVSKQNDSEMIGNDLVVFLKNGRRVEIE